MTTTAVVKTATGRKIGTCKWAGHRFAIEANADKFLICPTCKPVLVIEPAVYGYSWMKWATVKASKSDRKCDTNCTSAKGAVCACECSGEGHGRDWAV